MIGDEKKKEMMTAKVKIVSPEEIAAKGGSLLPKDYIEGDPLPLTREMNSGAGLTDEMKEVVLRTIRRFLNNPTAEMVMNQTRDVKKHYEPGRPGVQLEPGDEITLTLTITCRAKSFKKEE